jgi:hypothetical protein
MPPFVERQEIGRNPFEDLSASQKMAMDWFIFVLGKDKMTTFLSAIYSIQRGVSEEY